MATEITEKSFGSFTWSDLYIPSKEDVAGAAEKYSLGKLQVYDAVQSGHLPKYEKDDQFTFIILRGVLEEFPDKTTKVSDLSNKIAIFFNQEQVITIHGGQFNFLKQHIDDDFNCSERLVLAIVKNVLRKFDEPAKNFRELLSKIEEEVFLSDARKISLENIYFKKSQLRVAKNLLELNSQVINKLEMSKALRSEYQDLTEDVVHFSSIYNEIYENWNNLVSTYLSLNAQRNNDIVRVLTIFSAFFLPLTFIVGIYGMNFKYFPELDWRYGYPVSMAIMFGISLMIYAWFKKRGMM